MQERDLRYIGISFSWISLFIVGFSLLSAAGEKAGVEVILFVLWAISPYAIFILGEFVIRKIAIIPNITMFFCLIAFLLLVFTIWAYIGIFRSRSSTAGLAFLFLPFYLNILVTVITVIGLIWAAASKSSDK